MIPGPYSHHHVLLVDDDDDLREMIGASLRAEGFLVKDADSAESGLEQLRVCRELPQLVLLDFSLPGINGVEFLGRMHSLSPAHLDVPVILYSGDLDLERKTAGIPFQLVLHKPMKLDSLLIEIRKQLAA